MVHLLDLGVDVAVLADSIGAQLASCETVVFWAADFLYVDARLANACADPWAEKLCALVVASWNLAHLPSSVHIDRNTTHWADLIFLQVPHFHPVCAPPDMAPPNTRQEGGVLGVVHGKGLKNLAQPRPSKWKDPLLVQIPGSPGRGPLRPQTLAAA